MTTTTIYPIPGRRLRAGLLGGVGRRELDITGGEAMELHNEGQHTEVAPDMQRWIAERLDVLDAPYHDILHGRVTLVKSARHRRGSEEARVFLSLAGKTLSATRSGETLEDALYAVLKVIERELHDFRDIRRGRVKTSGSGPRGTLCVSFVPVATASLRPNPIKKCIFMPMPYKGYLLRSCTSTW